MRSRAIKWCGAALTLMLATAAQAADEELPETIKTSQREFSIPYDLAELDAGGESPAEVRLYVSEDQGAHWRVQEEAAPDAGSFQFRAPQLGEFWFAVRTVDRAGKCWPDDKPQAEMRVLVEPLHAAQAVKPGFPVNRMPAGTQARMVNSLSFELDYDVQKSDTTSPGKVELWWTGDGGLTWLQFGADEDCISPMLVGVEREGLYGFWMVIESAAGSRGETPKPGDLPQIWVGVDTTKPKAAIETAELKVGDKADQILVKWQATDALLAAQPVSLDYSISAAGPWTPLALDIDNRGVYACKINQHLPRTLFVRLQVRDEAGNIQVAERSTPLSVTVEQPTSVAVDAEEAQPSKTLAGRMKRSLLPSFVR